MVDSGLARGEKWERKERRKKEERRKRERNEGRRERKRRGKERKKRGRKKMKFRVLNLEYIVFLVFRKKVSFSIDLR